GDVRTNHRPISPPNSDDRLSRVPSLAGDAPRTSPRYFSSPGAQNPSSGDAVETRNHR
ncbi:jg1881, partial [Pararge aegeria aegeria]